MNRLSFLMVFVGFFFLPFFFNFLVFLLPSGLDSSRLPGASFSGALVRTLLYTLRRLFTRRTGTRVKNAVGRGNLALLSIFFSFFYYNHYQDVF